ncbi:MULTISPECIES: AzlD domain-containing protein [Halocynthiibacter]|uniref:AzlD domain-containing protein n=1 Tax=Halocynthiibacter halioticoli TaxID=2986804 RepID=A0AAE3LQ75_9RHOB|nr:MULTISPECIES: AzlD domain-containing protein [Halocynthiibacter]MCV6823213.1 AzlD domain-containing protein [Halocynthiibacter halioticoli]MCW4056214.1 AzlD domain-containing protein [Halocynthiibacter sp. SDUM655004]MDE0590820.1 AzlD domain-containing protein [Halocynthiibacter sp. C4]
MNYSLANIWLIIVLLGAGTYLIRFSFLGLLGGVQLPEWVLRHLRYTPVALIPGLVAPLVIWPAATGGETDPARLIAAVVTILVGYFTKSLVPAILAGGASLYLALYLL